MPRTIVTNDHAAVCDFASTIRGSVVCKTLSSLVHSEKDQVRITYTTPITPAEVDVKAVAATAHMVQEFIPKRYETRVTVAGATALGVAIHAHSAASKIDWRADYEALSYAPIDIPDALTSKLTNYLHRLGLSFGVFDFVVRPTGEWVMLEANPSGQWLWLQHETRIPIAAAVAALLTKGKVP